MLLPDYLTVLKRDPNGPIFCVKLLRFLKRGNLTHKIAAFVVTSRVDAPLDAVRKEGHSQAIQGVGASVLDLLASAHRIFEIVVAVPDAPAEGLGLALPQVLVAGQSQVAVPHLAVGAPALLPQGPCAGFAAVAVVEERFPQAGVRGGAAGGVAHPRAPGQGEQARALS